MTRGFAFARRRRLRRLYTEGGVPLCSDDGVTTLYSFACMADNFQAIIEIRFVGKFYAILREEAMRFRLDIDDEKIFPAGPVAVRDAAHEYIVKKFPELTNFIFRPDATGEAEHIEKLLGVYISAGRTEEAALTAAYQAKVDKCAHQSMKLIEMCNVAQEQMAVTTGTAGRQRSMSQVALQAFTYKLRELDHIARATESSKFREVFQHHDTANKRHLRKLLKLSPETPDSRCVDILRRPQSAGGGNAALTLDIA